ncbi:hypothetical protein HDU96_000603, partial [Phlyctochytrium bullatum]
IATTLIESTPDPNNADDSPACKEIANLQEFRKSLQESIGRLKTKMRRGEGEYEGSLVSTKIKEAEAKMYGVETKLGHADFEQALTTAREEVNQGRRQVNKEAEAVLMDWQKIQAAQKKEIAQAKIDDRISRAVRKLHLEAVDLLSRFDVVYLPKFDVKGMEKTTGNLGPMSKRILLRLRPAKFLDRLQQRMSLVGGAIFQSGESMTTQYRPLTGEIRSPGRKKVIKDVVVLNGKRHRVRTIRDADSCESLFHVQMGRFEKELRPIIFIESQAKLQVTAKKLSSIKVQQAGKEREKRISELSAKELDALPKETVAYKAVGRMFVKENLKDLVKGLSDKAKLAEKESKALQQAATKLEREAAETEKKLKDLLNVRMAMERASASS